MMFGRAEGLVDVAELEGAHVRFPLYFTAPKVRPRTSCFWLNQPMIRIGAIAITEAAESLAQKRPCGLEKLAMKAVSGAALVVVRRMRPERLRSRPG